MCYMNNNGPHNFCHFNPPLLSYHSLQQVLLQSEEELLAKRSAGLISEGASLKPKKIIGKMKVQGIIIFSLDIFPISAFTFA